MVSRRAWRKGPDLGSVSQRKNFNIELLKMSKTKSHLKRIFQLCANHSPSFLSRSSGTSRSPQGLLLWEVQPARQRTARLPSSCRVREGCPPSCHPRSREERALMKSRHGGTQSQPGRVLCRQYSLLIHTVTVWSSAQQSF